MKIKLKPSHKKIEFKKQHIIFFLLITFGIIFSFWKCRYGFTDYDEVFYITIPHRILTGDSLLSEEWHLSQLSSLLLLPFVAIYESIAKTMDGIVIYMRIVYIVCHCLVCVYIYTRLKIYKYGAVFSVFLYFIFTPSNIMALSYNTIALDSLVITGVINATYNNNKKLPYIIGGVVFSASVLCCPYLAIVYIIYAICIFINLLLHKLSTKYYKFKKFCQISDIFSVKRFLTISIGVIISVVLFSTFILSRASINDIMDNIIPILSGDQEHKNISLLQTFVNYFIYILTYCHKFDYIPIIFYIIIIIAIMFDKNHNQHRSIYLTLSVIVNIIHFSLFFNMISSVYYNTVTFPIMFTGLISYILCEEKPKKLFYFVFVLGVLYSFCINMASNTKFNAIFQALAVSNVANIIFIFKLTSEILREGNIKKHFINFNKISIISFYILMIVQTSLQIYVKSHHIFDEIDLIVLARGENSYISDGIAKGLTVSKEKSKRYYDTQNDLKYYDNKREGNILFLSDKTWNYLYTYKFPNASYSAWLSGVNETTIERLKTYYKLHQNKLPEYIYIDKQSAEYSKLDLSDIYETAEYNQYYVIENEVSYKLDKID